MFQEDGFATYPVVSCNSSCMQAVAIMNKLAAELDIYKATDNIRSFVLELLGCESVTLFLLDTESRSLRLAAPPPPHTHTQLRSHSLYDSSCRALGQGRGVSATHGSRDGRHCAGGSEQAQNSPPPSLPDAASNVANAWYRSEVG